MSPDNNTLIILQTTLPDIIPDLGPALLSKNPQVKEGTLKFLGRCLATATSPIQPAQVKSLAETLATLLEDGHESARNEAATCLGTLMKMVGERPLNAVVEGLADMRKAKVKEAYEKATVKCKAGAAAAPPKANAPPVPLTGKKKGPMAAKPPLVGEDDAAQPRKSATKPPTKHSVRHCLDFQSAFYEMMYSSTPRLSWSTVKKAPCHQLRDFCSHSEEATPVHCIQSIQS